MLLHVDLGIHHLRMFHWLARGRVIIHKCISSSLIIKISTWCALTTNIESVERQDLAAYSHDVAFPENSETEFDVVDAAVLQTNCADLDGADGLAD